MKIVEKIKNWFRRGGLAVGMGQEYGSILDHPKINMDENEHRRIIDNLRIYRGDHPAVRYLNSKGNWKERPLMSLNMMKEVADTLASVVFNEKCKIDIADPQAHEFITQVFEDNNFIENFAEYLEPMFAVGGLGVRPYIDTKDYSVKFSWAQANTFYPLHSNTNEIKECAIATVTTKVENKEKVYYTLLEFHEWENDVYVITNELYKSDKQTSLGKQVPLSHLYEDLQERTEIHRVTRPVFNYLKPAGFNNISPHSPLGLSVVDNAKNTLTQIDTSNDQFYWEVKMGQRKVAVSSEMTKVRMDREGNPVTVFDDESNVFLALRGEMSETFIKDLTNDIRAKDYIDSINHFFRILEMQTKLSTGTFNFDGVSVQKTATEVVSENSQTYKTRNKHLVNVEKFLKELIVSILELSSATINKEGRAVYLGTIPSFDDIGINFDDGVFTDKTTKLEHYSQAVDARFMPRREAIQRAMDVSEETAQEWILQMRREQIQFDPEYRNRIIPTALFGRDELNRLNEGSDNETD